MGDFEKEVLRRVVPGVQAKDYEVTFMDIYNLCLFLIGKHVNEILGEDVINYEDVFNMCICFIEQDHSSTVFLNGNGGGIVGLENVEEVAEYIQRIIHDSILIYADRINEITKKCENVVAREKLIYDSSESTTQEYNWLMNMKALLYNAAVDKDVMSYALPIKEGCPSEIFSNAVSPQLLEDETNVNIIKEMWRAAVEMIFIEFRQMVLSKVTGQDVIINTDKNVSIPIEDYPEYAAEKYMRDSVKEALLNAGIALNTPDPERERAWLKQYVEDNGISMPALQFLMLSNETEYSEIEESIIQKILQEKKQKISVG